MELAKRNVDKIFENAVGAGDRQTFSRPMPRNSNAPQARRLCRSNAGCSILDCHGNVGRTINALAGETPEAMQRSTSRILTTHTGSLPRPRELTRLYALRAAGGKTYGGWVRRILMTSVTSNRLESCFVVCLKRAKGRGLGSAVYL